MPETSVVEWLNQEGYWNFNDILNYTVSLGQPRLQGKAYFKNPNSNPNQSHGTAISNLLCYQSLC